MLILKILGFVLLGIVSLILLLLLLVLFVPVRYNGEFVKNDDDMHGSGKITWFLGIVCIKIKYADKVLEKNGRIAFKKLWKEKPKASEKKNGAEAAGTASTGTATTGNVTTDNDEKAENTERSENARRTETQKKTKRSKKTEKKKKPEGLTITKRIGNLFKNRDLLAVAWEDGKDAFFVALKRARRLLFHIAPKKIFGEVEFGFEDPDTTGKVLGIVSAAYACTGALLELKPDFENRVFRCDVHAKGRIRIFTVALIAVLLYFNKDLRKLGKRVKRLSEKVPEGE